MMNMMINAAISTTAAAEVATYWDELASEELVDRLQQEAEMREALCEEWRYDMARLRWAYKFFEETGVYDLYSDIFKDIYGVRPRW